MVPVDELDDSLFKVNSIIKLSDDKEYYVIKNIDSIQTVKTIYKDDKSFDYDCYKVEYSLLKDEFEKDVEGLHLYALTVEQEEILNDIRKQIQETPIVITGRKATCLDLWVYFVRCVQVHVKDHYTVLTFAKIANDLVDDFTSYLIKLFN